MSECYDYQEGNYLLHTLGKYLRDACKHSPGSSSKVINVGATNITDALYYRNPTTGSNFGTCVSLYAPGQSVIAADFNNTYR